MNVCTSAVAGTVVPEATPNPRPAKGGRAPGDFAQALRQQQARPIPGTKEAAPARSDDVEPSEGEGVTPAAGQPEPVADALSDAAPVLADPQQLRDGATDRAAVLRTDLPSRAPADGSADATQALLFALLRPGTGAGAAASDPAAQPAAGESAAEALSSGAPQRARPTDPTSARPIQGGAHSPTHGLQAAAEPATSPNPPTSPETGLNPASVLSTGQVAASAATMTPSAPATAAAPQPWLAEPVPPAPEAPPAATIEPEVGSLGFAPALGARVALLVREGVQEARLALHPADLGPIAVQIALDGQTASIHFQAEQATTRGALEASWPALAAALRDGGLTLAGGGVSQQGRGSAGQREPGPPAPARGAARHGRGDDGDVQEVAPRRRPVARGAVDLYA